MKQEKQKQKRQVIFDVETTGLDFETDEIIQFSAIDQFGGTLLNCYIKPEHTESWPEAAAVNGITPEMVADCPSFNFYRSQIQWIFDNADELISYNGAFDAAMLENHGIRFNDDLPHYDVMQEFAPIFGEYNEYYGSYKWQKLTTCAAYYGFQFRAHDSLEDVKATLYCYQQMQSQQQEAGNED